MNVSLMMTRLQRDYRAESSARSRNLLQSVAFRLLASVLLYLCLAHDDSV